MKYATGYRPDAHDTSKDPHLVASGLLGAIPTPSGTIDLTPDTAPIRDQGQEPACVGFGFARGIDTRARAMGRPLADYPSEYAIWALARQLETPKGPLPEDGCMPSDAAKGLALVGVVAEKRWPPVPATLHDGLAWDVLRAASEARLLPSQSLGFYRVQGFDQVRAALAHKYPVPIGMTLHESFQDYVRDIYVAKGAAIGGHMMCVVAATERAALVANQWGTDWGLSGFVWIPRSAFDDGTVSDAYAIDFAPPRLS